MKSMQPILRPSIRLKALVIDEGITFADLKGTLAGVCKRAVRTGNKSKIPSSSFPIHRAKCRGGRDMLQVWR